MPTLTENMRYAYETAFQGKRDRVIHYLVRFALVIIVSLFVELAVFNFNALATAGLHETDLTGQLNLTKYHDEETDEEYSMVTAVNGVLEFKVDAQVKDVYLGFSNAYRNQQLELKINFTDEGHKTYFDSTEYTEGVPNVEVSTFVEKSKYVNLNTAGQLGSLRIEVVDDGKVSYPLYIERISVNRPRPFEFNFLRFGVLVCLLALAYAFRPRSTMYKIGLVKHPRSTKGAIIATVLIEVFFVSGFLLYGSNMVGVATERYNYGSWDEMSVVNTFEVGGDNAQQYAELAKSISEGHLYLDQEPPQWLKDMSDPYDKGARDQLQKQSGENYLWDTAYYQGKYYVYFGVVPCVLFYLPFYLLTGANFPTAIGVLIMLLLFIVGCSALLDRFARHHFKNVSLGLYLLLQIPLVLCCGILYLAKFPSFYSLPIACALAFSIWGMYFWIRGRSSQRPMGWYLAGSFCMALVAGCRPQLLVFSLVAFPLFWRHYITNKRLFTPRGVAEFACLIAPYFIVAAGICGYNYARFGSFTDFGANYNLTVNDMTKRGMNAGRLAPALFAYFFQAPNVTGVFPFLQPVAFDTTYMGQTIKEATFGGIFACLPMLWILPFAPRLIKLRNSQRSTRTVAGVIGVLLVSGVVVALLDAEMAGILQRYYADFSFMFLASVVLLAFIANENLETGSLSKELLTKVLLALVALSVTYSMLLCFAPETGWYSDAYPWAYQGVIESVLFWT